MRQAQRADGARSHDHWNAQKRVYSELAQKLVGIIGTVPGPGLDQRLARAYDLSRHGLGQRNLQDAPTWWRRDSRRAGKDHYLPRVIVVLDDHDWKTCRDADLANDLLIGGFE